MSRIGKEPIGLPAGVMVALSPGRVQVNGPLGELSQSVPLRMTIEKQEETIVVTRPTDRGEDRSLHGLTRTLIANMVDGVTKGFETRLSPEMTRSRLRPYLSSITRLSKLSPFSTR